MPMRWVICDLIEVKGQWQSEITGMADPGRPLRHFDWSYANQTPTDDVRITWGGRYTGDTSRRYFVNVDKAGTLANATIEWGVEGRPPVATGIRINRPPVTLEDGITINMEAGNYPLGETWGVTVRPDRDVSSGYGTAATDLGSGRSLVLVRGVDLSPLDAMPSVVSVFDRDYDRGTADLDRAELDRTALDAGVDIDGVKSRVSIGEADSSITLAQVLERVSGNPSIRETWVS